MACPASPSQLPKTLWVAKILGLGLVNEISFRLVWGAGQVISIFGRKVFGNRLRGAGQDISTLPGKFSGAGLGMQGRTFRPCQQKFSAAGLGMQGRFKLTLHLEVWVRMECWAGGEGDQARLGVGSSGWGGDPHGLA